MCNNVLPIETGRWLRQEYVCNTNEVGDECHYIFKCPLFTEDRNSILPTRLCRNPNMYTVQHWRILLTNENYWNYASLCKSVYTM